MKRIISTIVCLCLTISLFCQITVNDKLIQLGNVYRNFMLRNEPTKEILKEIQSEIPKDMKVSTNFIVQTISSGNKLLTNSYLKLPDEISLKQIYIIRAINHNIRKEIQVDNYMLIDSLSTTDIPLNELINAYYGMLFSAVGNKNQPFDLSKTNFKLNEYGLQNSTQKGIFYLRCMELCGNTIWGLINIAKPANTKKALMLIMTFPKFNGLPYYQYNDFLFPDFEMTIIEKEGKQSYKSYYLNKYYDLLLNHLYCLNQEEAPQKEKENLLLGSILKEENLYKYSKDEQKLKSLFIKIDMNK